MASLVHRMGAGKRMQSCATTSVGERRRKPGTTPIVRHKMLLEVLSVHSFMGGCKLQAPLPQLLLKSSLVEGTATTILGLAWPVALLLVVIPH